MQTVIQELIKNLVAESESLMAPENDIEDRIVGAKLTFLAFDLKEGYLEKEKQQIIEAYEAGRETGSHPYPLETAVSYYNETYGK